MSRSLDFKKNKSRSEYTLPPSTNRAALVESSDSVAIKRVMSLCYFSYVNITIILEIKKFICN
jgi:hypothetical protein